MAENKREVVVKEQGFISDVSPDRWAMMVSQAETIVKSGICPKGDTKEMVVVKILAGREYGMSAMQALRSLYVVGQKVAMMSDTAAGLVFQRLPGAKIDCIETTDKVATFKASRPGGEPVTLSFTWEDAKKANLTGGVGWIKYPAQMLRARCQIAICRLVFPDVIAGLYTPEELGDKTERFEDIKQTSFEVQAEKEKKRLAKKELQGQGIIDTESEPVDTSTLPEGETPAYAPPAPPQVSSSSPNNPATKSQTGYILKLLDGLTPPQVDEFVKRIIGEPLDKATKAEASEFIAYLILPSNQAEIKQAKEALLKEAE